jgi:4'-phosphopantetheinyl transferase
MMNVLYAYEIIDGRDPAEALGSAALSEERRARIASRSRREAIAASLLGDRLARRLAGRLCACDPESLLIRDGQYGRPILEGANAWVSIAHSGEYAAAAASLYPVGIDIERQRPISETVMRRICSREELIWLDSSADLTLPRFFRLWTMKEAYGKMYGVGILSSRHFYARIEGNAPAQRYGDCTFLFPDAPEGYALSICTGEK